MAEAWMVRGAQRQRLLEKLMGEVYREAENFDDDRFFYYMAEALIDHLHDKVIARRPFHGKGWGNSSYAKDVVVRLLPEIEDFTRTSSEENFILVEFLNKVVHSIYCSVSSKLRHDEIFSPETIFQAPISCENVVCRFEDYSRGRLDTETDEKVIIHISSRQGCSDELSKFINLKIQEHLAKQGAGNV